DDVSLPLADEASNGAAVLQSRQQLAVMNVQHLGGDAENFSRFLNFRRAATSQWSARLAPVTYITVRHRDKLDVMPLSRPHSGRAADLQLAVIRVRAEADDPQFAVVGRRLVFLHHFQLRPRVHGPGGRISVASDRAAAKHQSQSYPSDGNQSQG